MEKERLAEYLEQYHLGEFNAATSRELELTFGIKGIEVRHLVNQLRRDGVPIASSGSGYFYAATEQEVRATIAHLTRRISGIAAGNGSTRSRPASRWTEVIPPEQLHELGGREESSAGGGG